MNSFLCVKKVPVLSNSMYRRTVWHVCLFASLKETTTTPVQKILHEKNQDFVSKIVITGPYYTRKYTSNRYQAISKNKKHSNFYIKFLFSGRHFSSTWPPLSPFWP